MNEDIFETPAPEMRPKVVTWHVSTNEFLPTNSEKRRSAPNREKLSRREQPTWQNCKQLRQKIPCHRHIRTSSAGSTARTSSTVSSRSIASVCTATNSSVDESENSERGREVLRRKAKVQLRSLLPTCYREFDSSDLMHQSGQKHNYTMSRGVLRASAKFRDVASARVAPKRKTFFINGVHPSAYRRPSVQINNEESNITALCVVKPPSRRYSEPTISVTAGSAASSHQISTDVAKKTVPAPLSRSVASTLGTSDSSNSENKNQRKHRPSYLDRDWQSDIMTRYAVEQPWVPKHRTTRYFPKFSNMQDLNCRNPYLGPAGFLSKSR